MYDDCVSRLVVVWYLVMLHVRHVYVLETLVKLHVRHVFVLLPLVRPYVRHARLGLYIAVNLKGRTTRIWSFGYSFACATAMGCAGFKLLFGKIIVL